MLNQLLLKQRRSAGSGGPSGPRDPKFNLVSLILNGDGTNGDTNNIFLDNSENNYAVTRFGAPGQGSFSPHTANGWSNEFASASTQYFTLAASSQFQITGDWTIECWIYLNAYSSSSADIVGNFQTNAAADWVFLVNSIGLLQMYPRGSSAGTFASGGTVPLNAWTHVAAVRSGTTVTTYLNGVQVGTVAVTGTLGDNTRVVRVGSRGTVASSVNGLISNLRIVRSALYTANFTPSTTDLEVISGQTSLLTCRSNRVRDLSPNNHATAVFGGGPTVRPNSPFPWSSYYNPENHGGSVYFPGTTSDYLSVAAGTLGLGTQNWTFETWVYPTSLAAVRGLVSQWPALANAGFQISIQTSGFIQQSYRIAGATVTSTGTTAAVRVNMWNHIAVVRNGSTFTIYVNGVADATTLTNAGSIADPNVPVLVGLGGDAANPMIGYMSDTALTIGSALYTAAFTPATAPIASTGKKFLLRGTNGGIVDKCGKNVVVTQSNARVSSTSKYGSGSILHDGTNATFLDIVNNEGFNFGTGNFTVEAWVYVATANSGQSAIIGRWGTSPGTVTDWLLFIDNLGRPAFIIGSTQITGTALSTGSWHHIAATRSGNTLNLWVNGVSVATTTTSASVTVGARNVRTSRWDSGVSFLNGYLDDIRVTKGDARYTTAFTPPAEALPIY